MSFITDFQRARANNEPYKVFRSIFNVSQTLDDFIDFAKNSLDGRYRDQSKGIHLREGLYPDMMPFDHTFDFFNLMKDSYADDYHDQNSFTMLISELDTYRYSGLTGVPAHSDPQDNIHWNCIGESLWLINGDELTLYPGDILYIKSGITHDVKTLKPRAAIIFSI